MDVGSAPARVGWPPTLGVVIASLAMIPSSELARLASEALSLALWVSAPALLASLVVGLLVAIASATTQVQEQALTHVPRMAAVALVLLTAGAWMSAEIARFTTELFTALPTLVH